MQEFYFFNILTSFVETLVRYLKIFIIITRYLVGSACYYLASKDILDLNSGGMKAGGSYEQR